MHLEPNDDVSGALVESADAIAMCGSTGRWAVWGQRDWEIGILLTDGSFAPPEDSVPSFSDSTDLELIRSPEGYCVPLSPSALREFHDNWRAEAGSLD